MGGGLIEWVRQFYNYNEPYSYEMIEKDALGSSLGAGGLIFLPYLLGERMPVWDSNVRSAFWGLERFHTRREMTRAVLESTGFIALDMMRSVEKIGVNISDIRFSGGLSRIDLVSQIKADITNRKILVLSDHETTAIGAAMLVLTGQKIIPSWTKAVECFVSIRMIAYPNKKNHEKYLEVFKLYKNLYAVTKNLFAEQRMHLIKNVLEKQDTKIEKL